MPQLSYNEIFVIVREIVQQDATENTSLYEVFEDSIQMFRFLGEVKSRTGINLGMLDLVKAENLGDLVQKISEKLRQEAGVEKEIPLTPMQQSYLLGREQDFHGKKNSTHIYFELEHSLDLEKAESCLQKLIERHEALRAFVKEESCCILSKDIAKSFRIEKEISLEKDLPSLLEKKRLQAQTGMRPLDKWPLFRIENVKTEKRSIATVDLELIFIDGLSAQGLAAEFLELYETGYLPEFHFEKDPKFIEWEKSRNDSEKREADKAFWENLEETIPESPKLPTLSNVDIGENICRRAQHALSKETVKSLEIHSRKNGVTSSVVLFYLYLKTLSRFSESGNFSVNITKLNRPYGLEGIEHIIGDYTSNVLFDCVSSEYSNSSVRECLQKVRDKMYERIDHSAYEGVEVIRDLIRQKRIDKENPMPIVFTSMLFGRLPAPKDVRILYVQSQTSQVSVDNQICKTHDGGILVSWDYLEKIFPKGIIDEMFRHYVEGIESFAKSGNFPTPTPSFEAQVSAYNQTKKAFPVKNPIKILERNFQKFKDRPALQNGALTVMTYGELEISVRKAMASLKASGVHCGDSVAILSQKNFSTVVAILAAMGVGATYIPVDAKWPKDRKDFILKNSQCKLSVEPHQLLEGQTQGLCDFSPNPDLNSTAYVIYTSGSTGVPKGVLISYASMMNTLLDINERMGVREDSTVLGLSSYCFDLSVYDIFGTLLAGATLDIAKDIRETAEIRRFMDNGKNILWNSVPAGMELFIDSLDDSYVNADLKTVLLSGDWIPVSLPDRIRRHFPEVKIYSLGGATEASIWSIYFPIESVEPSWQSIPYGYPLKNQTVYVLNESLEICPPEVQGEIFIGGKGVARGYANSEEKTRAAFLEHSRFGRLYKTGDFGKFSSEGYVVFLGRKDSQVKVGGYRIELGEIEHRMCALPKVESAVVLLDSKRQIVAFYTGEKMEKDSFKSSLSEFLPSYMIPHKFIHLDFMPLSSNGKIDRKNLLERLSQSSEGSKPLPAKTALTEIQRQILSIYRQVLGLEDIDSSLDFFELGGDSITAQRIAGQIEKRFRVRVPFVSILNAKDAKEFAEFVENKIRPAQEASTSTEGHAVEGSAEFPMTGVQLAYLNGRNASFELGKYNAHYYFEIETPYSAEELEDAVRKVVKKHDAFRAVFYPNGMQKVLEKVPDYKIQVEKSSPQDFENDAQKIRKELSHHVYAHDKWPLFTFRILESGPKRLLFVSFDLMVCDGDSMQIFFSDLGKILRHGNFESHLGYSYERYLRDLSHSKDEKRYAEDKAYWQERIPNLPEYPHVPLAQKISSCTEYSMERLQTVIAKKTWAHFKEAAKAHRVSPAALLCTIYAKVLSHWSNQNHFTLNLTAFERKPFHSDVEKIIGDFTKLLPLELLMDEKDLWKSATDVQSRIMDGLEHLSYDGTEIMRELSKSRGLFGKAVLPVVFTCVLFDAPENYYEILGKLRHSISQTPQVFIDNQIAEMGQKLYINWDVVKELFHPEIIRQIFTDFVENIRYVAIGENRLLFPETDAVWNDYNPPVNAPANQTLHVLFTESFSKFKNRTAVVGKGKSLTYAELDSLSNRIAAYLMQHGTQVGDRVAVLGERAPETIAAILGILKSGAAYVPIDDSYPKERVDFILQDADCKFLLKKEVVESEAVMQASDKGIPTTSRPKDEAYIIYTSGSTGTPKGVVMSHAATANTILDIDERLDLNESDALIGISSICFDLSVYDIFGTLSRGAKLVLVDDPRDMEEVDGILSRERITVWNSVPILFSMAMKHRISTADDSPLFLRKVLLSGDRIPLDICETAQKAKCDADLISLGGATEAAIWSIIYPFKEVRPEWDSIPYGRPLKNQTFYVLDAERNLCPREVQGELYIGGVGLAKGYNNDPEKTAKAFIEHPKFGRIYRTGDLGKLKTESFIEFLGRSDTQVKWNGFRIELGEIEAALVHTGLVKNAVAALKEFPGGKKQLIAYCTGAEIPDAEEVLKNAISKNLVAYMMPSRILLMDAFPLSANGKVDRKKLPIPETSPQKATPRAEENLTVGEADVLRIYRKVFENPAITLDDDFYSLGGDSITLMKLIDALASELQKTASIDQILQSKNIRELAHELEMKE